jgi:hypothetical protein
MSHGQAQGDKQGKDERNAPHDTIMNGCACSVKR